MDFTEGEIRFKTSVDLEDSILIHKFIQNLVYMNVLMMDKYLLGIMSVIMPIWLRIKPLPKSKNDYIIKVDAI